MRQINLIILILVLTSSCIDNSTTDDKSQTVDSITHVQSNNIETNSTTELSVILAKAVQYFPNDSASLHRFYFKYNSTTDQDKINKQIKRLENLTSKESVDRYKKVENNLKLLLTNIVSSSTISKSQSDSLVILYSDYDYFSGESLFSDLLTNHENYELVWQSFKIMVTESSKDTCFISGLIKLDNNIKTNVELAEAMQDFKVQAIRNNPLGFLDMFMQREGKQRSDFAKHISIWDDPDKELIIKYAEISENSNDENYRKFATELIDEYKN